MRTVFNLDRVSVEARAAERASDEQGAKLRRWTLPLLPILGLAPAWLQKRWADGWAYPAEKATWLSIVASLLIGGLGLIQSMALVFGGEWFLPRLLHPLVFVGPYLFAEGMLRNALVAADGEPVGSIFGWPLNFWRPQKRDREVVAPRVRMFDENVGNLELESPVHRRDWHSDGTLGYRGQDYRLDAVAVEGEVWVYRFARCTEETGTSERLRLIPPPAQPTASPEKSGSRPSMLRTALVTAAVTLGPQKDQEIWAGYLNLRPIWLTIFGAGAEVIGALVNLGKDIERGMPLLLLIDLYLVGEGLLRLGYVVLYGRPLGSVVGLVLRPLYRPWLPEPGESR
jgi:hypothetical protein